MHIVNGIIEYNKIPNEKVLHIKTANEGNRTLLNNLQQIISEYGKHITCIEFSGTEGDVNELITALKIVHKAGLKTSFLTSCNDVHDLVEKLLDELDYTRLKNAVLKRDYCPFAECYDWIEV